MESTEKRARFIQNYPAWYLATNLRTKETLKTHIKNHYTVKKSLKNYLKNPDSWDPSCQDRFLRHRLRLPWQPKAQHIARRRRHLRRHRPAEAGGAAGLAGLQREGHLDGIQQAPELIGSDGCPRTRLTGMDFSQPEKWSVMAIM